MQMLQYLLTSAAVDRPAFLTKKMAIWPLHIYSLVALIDSSTSLVDTVVLAKLKKKNDYHVHVSAVICR